MTTDFFEGLHDWQALIDEPSEDDLMLRNSTVGSWDLCPGRVGYSDHEGFEHTPSEAMSFGTMGHGAIEQDLIQGLHLWTMDELEGVWRDGLLSEESGTYDLDKLATPEKIHTSTEEAVVMMAAWQQDVYPQLNLSDYRFIEEKLVTPLGILPSGRGVWFHGTPDVVDVGNPKIYDWKTTGRAWKESKVLGLNAPQAYSWLANTTYDVFIPDHHYWVWNRTKREWDLHTTQRNQAHVDAYLRKAWGVARAIDAQAFPFQPWSETFGNVTRGWWCSPRYCGAWDICEGKDLPDDLVEATPIDIKLGWA